MHRLFCRTIFIGTGVGAGVGCLNLHKLNHVYCENDGNAGKLSTGFYSKLINFGSDFFGTLSHSYKTGDIFHELKRREVQIELTMLLLPLIFGGFTSYRLYLIKKRKWNNKDFHDIINISLNTIVRNKYAIQSLNNPFNYHIHYRTLIETNAQNIINDDQGIKLLTKTVQKCITNNCEIIQISDSNKNDKDAHWAICSAIMSQISHLSSYGYIYRDVLIHDKLQKSKNINHHEMELEDDEVISTDYIMAITCEGNNDKVSKTNKIRVILLNKLMATTILNDYKTHFQTDDISTISNDKWMQSLENYFSKDLFRSWNNKRWLLIKKILQIYDKQHKVNDKLDWSKPLCDLELVVVKHQNWKQYIGNEL